MARVARTAILLLAALAAGGATPTTLPQTPGIVGTITIDRGTGPTTLPSTRPTTRPAGEQWTLALTVAGTTEYGGHVVRRADGRLVYDLAITVASPKDLTRKKQVGRISGEVPTGGGYDLSGLALSVDAPDRDGHPVRFAEPFAGRAATKPAGLVTYARTVDGRVVPWTLDNARRVRLTDVILPMGPVPLYARTTAGGHLDVTAFGVYVDATLTTAADAKTHDTLTGTVRRVDGPVAGQGHCDVDLRFNAPFAPAGKGVHGRDPAFFTPDPAAAGLRGTVEFAVDAGDPRRLTLTVRLNADGLSKPQTVAAFKLALLCLGPLDDAMRP